MARPKKPRRLACRYCGDTIDASNPDSRSHWLYQHPSACPARADRVPRLNGVQVGQRWRNRHTGAVEAVTAIRLGGDGTYTDREPTVDLGERSALPATLWSLAEHWTPVDGADAMPFDGLPVPVEPDQRFAGSVSALRPWRTGGFRGDRNAAYYSTRWRRSGPYTIDPDTGWSLDPDAAPTLLDGAQEARTAAPRATRPEPFPVAPAPASGPDSGAHEQLALTL